MPTLDDLLTTVRDTDGTQVLTLQSDGTVVYIHGPKLVAYVQTLITQLATRERQVTALVGHYVQARAEGTRLQTQLTAWEATGDGHPSRQWLTDELADVGGALSEALTKEVAGQGPATAGQQAVQELRSIDQMLAGRPALTKPTRIENIALALHVAGTASDRVRVLESQLEGALQVDQRHLAEAATQIRTCGRALHRYGDHDGGCVTRTVQGAPCTCGYQAALDLSGGGVIPGDSDSAQADLSGEDQ